MPVVKSILAAKLTMPKEEVFCNTDKVLLLLFAIAKSGFSSPSISPMLTEIGLVPVAKSALGAKQSFLQ